MDFNSFIPGWTYQPEAIAESVEYFAAQGKPVGIGDEPALKGFWKSLVARGVTAVFLHDEERIAFGKNLKADLQARGTCTGRGNHRALQYSMAAEINAGMVSGVPKEACYEIIYAYSRTVIGRNQLGRGDGSVGGWVARAAHDVGLLPRGVYGKWDLSRDREDLAVLWGTPGNRVPQELINASAPYKVQAAHKPATMDDLADMIAAKVAGAFCSNTIWGNRGPNGFSHPARTGGHCECVTGVLLDENGETAFVRQQSWGDQPSGPSVLKYAGGTVQLEQGAYGASGKDTAAAMHQGECWGFWAGFAYPASSVGDMT